MRRFFSIKTLAGLLIALFLADLTFSFFQHQSMPLDGDIAEAVVPAEHFKPIFENPLGITTLLDGQSYPNPNRFFSHWPFKLWLSKAPLFLQTFLTPIESVYAANAIIKTLMQLLLVLLLAYLSVGGIRKNGFLFLLAVFLIFPFFQTNGQNRFIGIIDQSITYAFNYAWAILLLSACLFPVFTEFYFRNKPMKTWIYLFVWLPLALISALSGPLNSGITLVACFVIGLRHLVLNWKSSNPINYTLKTIPSSYYKYFLPLILFSVWSFLVGRHNSNNDLYPFKLAELYALLPTGIWKHFTDKPAAPILLVLIILNISISKWLYNSDEARRMRQIFGWVVLAIIIYILLLPMGGYRVYRPYVLRYDTMIPVTMAMIFMFARSAVYIYERLRNEHLKFFAIYIAGVATVFTIADKPHFNLNACEKQLMATVAKSEEKVVLLPQKCTLITWNPAKQPEETIMHSKLLVLWNITEEEKLWYQKPAQTQP